MNTRGDFGVGSLIIFIAMILVAAIAAGVLIATTNETEQDVYQTGEDVEDELVRSAFIQEIAGMDGREGSITNLTITARLVGGSQPLRFKDVIVEVVADGYDSYYHYTAPLNNTQYCAASQSAQWCGQVAQPGGSGYYTIEYMKTSSRTVADVIGPGDVVRMHVPLATTLEDGDWFRVSILPSNGQKQYLEVYVPEQVGGYIVHVYPK
jgi:archaeal flagellin FlaB